MVDDACAHCATAAPWRSDLDAAADSCHGVPSDPDRAVAVLGDPWPSGAVEARPLPRRVRGGGSARRQQPLRDRRVEAPRDRILADDSAVAGEDRPHFERGVAAFWMGT